MSVANFSQIGDADKPSPSIWADCPKTLLNDLGLGFFFHEDFLAFPTGTLAAALDVSMVTFGGHLKLDADTDTVLAAKSGETGGYLDIETDGDDNDAAALFTQQLGTITANSGKKFWAEIRMEVGAVADQGVFFGIVEEDATDGTTTTARDVLSDDVANNSVVAESLAGFISDAGDTDAIDLILKKDAGTAEALATNVTNSAQITAGGGTAAALAANTEVKLGMRFDGRETMHFYVNGHKVATDTVDTNWNQTATYGVVYGHKTGAVAAVSTAIDWIRVGYQSKSG
jgi:hypothetical protein